MIIGHQRTTIESQSSEIKELNTLVADLTIKNCETEINLDEYQRETVELTKIAK